jgi:phosphate acetyltransferase
MPMSDSLYITSMEPRAGKAVVALGVLELLSQRFQRIAIFRPIVAADDAHDPLLDMLVERYRIDETAASAVGFSYAVAAAFESRDRPAFLAAVIDKAATLRRDHDFVLYLGTDYSGSSPATEFALNADLAVNLAAPVLDVVSGNGRDAPEILAAAREARRLLKRHGSTIAATVVNRVGSDIVDDVREAVANRFAPPCFVIPEVALLAALTVQEVTHALGGVQLAGSAARLSRETDGYLAGSGYLPTVLPRLREDVLLVTSGDRADLAAGLGAAATDPAMPTAAGIVFTCGIRPEPEVLELLASAGVPVACVGLDTYAALRRLENRRGEITATSTRKISVALEEFARSVDIEALAARIDLVSSDSITPAIFTAGLLDRARRHRRTIVLPESEDDRVLQAIGVLSAQDAIDVVVLGDEATVAARADLLHLDISRATIIDPELSTLRNSFARTYTDLRAAHGMTLGTAMELMADPTLFATMLVFTGVVDGMVSGATHTTADTIRPAFQIIKKAEDSLLVSSAFFMCLPTRVLVFADCAVNRDPSAAELAEIARCTATTAAAFGFDPRVAFVSYSTGTSGVGADVDKVRQATELLLRTHPELAAVGPIQYDAAVDPLVALMKLPDDPVAGTANVLIFPDLNTGNTTYKAVQRSGGVVAIGPILQGLRYPVNDLSRGCTVEDIVTTTLVTAIQCYISDVAVAAARTTNHETIATRSTHVAVN